MLYVNMVVNKVPVVAFVDSGAQSTIMSVQCAQRCNLERLIDRRYAGTAVGVGTAKIVERVCCKSDQPLSCSFTIIDNQSMSLLFGLDMLKKFQVLYCLHVSVVCCLLLCVICVIAQCIVWYRRASTSKKMR